MTWGDEEISKRDRDEALQNSRRSETLHRSFSFENVWQYMRDNWLSNRIYKDYDDIVEHCCAAWNKLVDQPWKIMSIGHREWARRS